MSRKTDHDSYRIVVIFPIDSLKIGTAANTFWNSSLNASLWNPTSGLCYMGLSFKVFKGKQNNVVLQEVHVMSTQMVNWGLWDLQHHEQNRISVHHRFPGMDLQLPPCYSIQTYYCTKYWFDDNTIEIIDIQWLKPTLLAQKLQLYYRTIGVTNLNFVTSYLGFFVTNCWSLWPMKDRNGVKNWNCEEWAIK